MLAGSDRTRRIAALDDDREYSMTATTTGIHGSSTDAPIFLARLHDLVDLVRGLHLRGASRSLDAVRTASKIKKKPPTSIIPGNESRRWREGASTRRDAEIAPDVPAQRAELPPFQDVAVEEAQRTQYPLKRITLRTGIKVLRLH